MDLGAVDLPALALGALIAALIASVLLVAARREERRTTWIVAGVLVIGLAALGVVEILAKPPREMHLATPVFGALLPVLGVVAALRASRRLRVWARWPIAFVTAFVLLFAGVVFGAAILPRWLPG